MTSTNYPSGVTNVRENGPLGAYPAPSPGRIHQFFDDFDTYQVNASGPPLVGGSYIATAVGSSTAAVTSADNGILTITTGASSGNGISMQYAGLTGTVLENFRWDSLKNMWMEIRFQVSEASASSLALGLAITDTTASDATDALFFTKDAASTALQFKAVKNSTATTINAGTLTAGVFNTLGFWYSGPQNGDGLVRVYLNNQIVGATPVTANFPDDEDIAPTLVYLSGSAGAKTMLVDYITIAKDR